MFPDVPDMWAKDAVAALAAKGILEGYPDGTFKGDRAATRYEVAMIVARLLAKMEQEHATFATKADLDELRKLVGQLREELDALGVRVQNLEDNVTKLDKRVTELERITFYGSLDTRFVSMRLQNNGLNDGTNGTLAPANPNVTIPTPANPQVGIPFFGSTVGEGRPTAVNAFPWNASSFNNKPTDALRPSYNVVVGSTYSLGSAPIISLGVASASGIGQNPLLGITGLTGLPAAVPLVLPVFEVRSGRPWTKGVGWSGQGILGLRIKLNDDMDAGAEFASYFTTGDAVVDAYHGVSASRLSNAFAGNTVLGGTGTGQNDDHTLADTLMTGYPRYHEKKECLALLGVIGSTPDNTIPDATRKRLLTFLVAQMQTSDDVVLRRQACLNLALLDAIDRRAIEAVISFYEKSNNVWETFPVQQFFEYHVARIQRLPERAAYRQRLAAVDGLYTENILKFL